MQPKPLTADELRRQAATGEMPRWMLVKNPERTIELLNIEDVRPLTREEELELEQLLGDRVEERPSKEKAQSVQAVMAQIANSSVH